MVSGITKLARKLRREQTPAEKQVWYVVRNRKLGGYKFYRQYPIIHGKDNAGKTLFFIADFYCHERQLVLELDGKIHENQKEYDANRDAILRGLGLRVLRVKNEEVDNLDRFKELLLDELKKDLAE